MESLLKQTDVFPTAIWQNIIRPKSLSISGSSAISPSGNPRLPNSTRTSIFQDSKRHPHIHFSGLQVSSDSCTAGLGSVRDLPRFWTRGIFRLLISIYDVSADETESQTRTDCRADAICRQSTIFHELSVRLCYILVRWLDPALRAAQASLTCLLQISGV